MRRLRGLPLVLREEVIVDGAAVVVLLDGVVLGAVGDAEEEVGEVDAGVVADGGAGGGVTEGAVVIGAEEAERGDGSDGADISTELEGVIAVGPAEGIGVDEDVGLIGGGETADGESLHVLEGDLGQAVEEEVLKTDETEPVGEGVAVETVVRSLCVEGIAEVGFVDQVGSSGPGDVGAEYAGLIGVDGGGNEQRLRGKSGVVFPGEAAPDEELLICSEVLISADVELVAVL